MNAEITKVKKKKTLAKADSPVALPLLADVRKLIVQAREGVARAEYGGQIVSALGRQLETEFGRGYSRRNLFHMIRFAEVFPELKIVQSLIAQLGWTHFLHIIRFDDPLKRDFYAEMCRVN
jgi:hypothetical protein